MKILKTITDPISGERFYNVLFSDTTDTVDLSPYLLTGGGIGAGALAGRGIARKISGKNVKNSLKRAIEKQNTRGENLINSAADKYTGGREEAKSLAKKIQNIEKHKSKAISGKKEVARKLLKKSGRRGALIGAGVGGALAGGGYLLNNYLQNNQDRLYSRGGIRQKLFFDYSALEHENPELAKKVREGRSELARKIREQRSQAFRDAQNYKLKTTDFIRQQGGVSGTFKNAPEFHNFLKGNLSPERTAEINDKIRGSDIFKKTEESLRQGGLRSDLERISRGAKIDKSNLGVELGKNHQIIGKDGGMIGWDQGKMNIFRNDQVFKDGKWVDIPKKQPEPKPQTTPKPEPKPQLTQQIKPEPKPEVTPTAPPKPAPTNTVPTPPRKGKPSTKPNLNPKRMNLGRGGKIALGATLGTGLLAGGAYLLSRDKKNN